MELDEPTEAEIQRRQRLTAAESRAAEFGSR
jgi:hypothetical protein